ncbi:MAG: hypothetical protein BWY63_03668 [Chloroflexi bacterium ADurb.Bin360]|nr:MAG: hypothetical protein BWY63_03668 [Chloroflexi bacterium ADurb.Bin360]
MLFPGVDAETLHNRRNCIRQRWQDDDRAREHVVGLHCFRDRIGGINHGAEGVSPRSWKIRPCQREGARLAIGRQRWCIRTSDQDGAAACGLIEEVNRHIRQHRCATQTVHHNPQCWRDRLSLAQRHGVQPEAALARVEIVDACQCGISVSQLSGLPVGIGDGEGIDARRDIERDLGADPRAVDERDTFQGGGVQSRRQSWGEVAAGDIQCYGHIIRPLLRVKAADGRRSGR